jgi:uracil-DNA glycosylase family 4
VKPFGPAATPADVAQQARAGLDLARLDACVVECRACPRLVAWREAVAHTKRAAYAEETYWGRPIPGWGPADAAIAIVGLAPAAHGGNRTGRIFTGDRSGDWLFAALWRAGLARRPTSITADDGQQLLRTRMMAAVRCAPPANKPTPAERDTCAPWLARELELLRPTVRVVVALGGFAWQALGPALRQASYGDPVARVAFGHGAELALAGGVTVLGCYHPSQQNTFTGRLTEPMLDGVFGRAVALSEQTE